MRFAGKVGIVTGAASGIGRSAALRLASEGALVAIADLSDSGLEVVESITRAGGTAFFQATDVADPASVEALVSATVSRFGRLDFALNNAGRLAKPGATAEVDLDDWNRVVAVNMTGVLLSMKYEIRQMLQQGGGAIVNLLSGASLAAYPGYPAYVASKHGALGATRAAALEYARSNIRVNAICPSLVRTPMKDVLTGGDAGVETAFEDSFPIGRMAEPEEIAALALWLLSDEASYMNGAAVAADGGISARS